MSKTKDLRLYESKLAVGLYAPYDLWIGVPHRRSISHRIVLGDLEIWLSCFVQNFTRYREFF